MRLVSLAVSARAARLLAFEGTGEPFCEAFGELSSADTLDRLDDPARNMSFKPMAARRGEMMFRPRCGEKDLKR